MSNRTELTTQLIVDGQPFTVKLIHNPIIDDVVLTEAKIYAFQLEHNSIDPQRTVSRDIRDFLIRLGVER